MKSIGWVVIEDGRPFRPTEGCMKKRLPARIYPTQARATAYSQGHSVQEVFVNA